MSGGPTEAIAPARGDGAVRAPRPQSARSRRAPPQALTAASKRLAVELQRVGLPIHALVRRFPHIVNRLSASWSVPMEVVGHLDELLVDRRGGRRGLPADALAEVLLLREALIRRAAQRRSGGG